VLQTRQLSIPLLRAVITHVVERSAVEAQGKKYEVLLVIDSGTYLLESAEGQAFAGGLAAQSKTVLTELNSLSNAQCTVWCVLNLPEERLALEGNAGNFWLAVSGSFTTSVEVRTGVIYQHRNRVTEIAVRGSEWRPTHQTEPFEML
jgi:hypothetical protein